MITRDRDLLREDGTPSRAMLLSVVREFGSEQARLKELGEIYRLNHKIDNKQRGKNVPNIKLTHDLPGYIVAVSAGYLLGEPVQYSDPDQQDALDALTKAYSRANIETVDAELAVDAAVYGKAAELCYADAQGLPKTAQVSPVNAFVVYDDTVEHAPLFGVILSDRRNERGERTGLRMIVYTDTQVLTYEGADADSAQAVRAEPHYFGGVPLVEYWNNAQECGDFERVKNLIDAYDLLQSDRVTNKEQFVDALLLLLGVSDLGEPDDPEDKRPPAQRLREDRMLTLPGEKADAKFLCQEMHEADVQVLRDALIEDIHKLSMVPDLTDKNFSSNASGVAMRYKLFGLEQLTNTKERWFKEGLRCRMRLFARFLAVRGARLLDAETVTITMKRSLPVNEVEAAQVVQTLHGMVPEEILLGQLPFVQDVGEAVKLLKKQREEAMKQQQLAFGAYSDANEKQIPREE